MKEYIENRHSIDGEKVFTFVMLLVAVYMFIGASDYSSRAATFPRMAAGGAIVGCVLLLFSSYLPGPIRTLVEEEANIVDVDDDNLVEGDGEEDRQAEGSAADANGEAAAVADETAEAPARDPGAVADEAEVERTAETAGTAEKDDVEPINSFYTGALIVGYVVTAYLFTFLLATPAFMAAYAYAFNINRYYAAGLVAAGIVIVVGFQIVLGVPLNEGALITIGVL